MKKNETRDDWLAYDSNIRDDFTEYWGGEWGCDSEVGTLKSVLLRRPGKEIEDIADPKKYRWQGVMDPAKARDQHDALADVYRVHGIEVHYVENMREDKPNTLFMRDNVLMTPEGAIVGRQAMECRRGEERYAAEALARLGVPVIRTISGAGLFETACCMWMDKKTVLIGTGNRANDEGAGQVEEVLVGMGVDHIIHIQIPYGFAHIDGTINFADTKTAVINPVYTSWDTLNALKERGVTVLEATFEEETRNLSLNFVALSPGHVVMPSGNPETKKLLEDNWIEVTETDVSELLKGWGSIHCMTAVLKREPVGKVF